MLETVTVRVAEPVALEVPVSVAVLLVHGVWLAVCEGDCVAVRDGVGSEPGDGVCDELALDVTLPVDVVVTLGDGVPVAVASEDAVEMGNRA